MSSSDIIARAVLPDLQLNFYRQQLLNVNISDTMRASVKMRAMNLIEIDIRRRMASLRMLNTATLA